MYQLNKLGNEAKQQITMYLDDNTEIVFNFEYKANQLGWFFGFQYNNQSYQNLRLVTSYNILRAYRAYLPFGLRCDTLDGEEPMEQDDFTDGYATVYLLTSDDVEAIEGNYYARAVGVEVE